MTVVMVITIKTVIVKVTIEMNFVADNQIVTWGIVAEFTAAAEFQI